MNTILQNKHLEIAIKPKGAELFSIFSKETKLNYMWSGDANVWGKTSPILFPIVGTLKDDTYFWGGEKYSLPRHGFARDQVFELASETPNSAKFKFKSNAETLKIYPFNFELGLTYTLEENALTVGYEVINKGEGKMLFSIGAHPAFSVPMVQGTTYEDYYLLFNKKENAARWPINKAGLIMQDPIELIKNSNRLNLTKTLFENDALVFKNLQSNELLLRSDLHSHGLDFYFEGFSFMGIWAAENADFVCIEPWCGIADGVNHNQLLEDKEGIEIVHDGKTWSREWKAKFF